MNRLEMQVARFDESRRGRQPGERRSHKLALIGTVAVCFVVAMISLQFLSWQGNREMHTITEVVATLLAASVGVLALVRFYSKKNVTYLFLAILMTIMWAAYAMAEDRQKCLEAAATTSPPSRLIEGS